MVFNFSREMSRPSNRNISALRIKGLPVGFSLLGGEVEVQEGIHFLLESVERKVLFPLRMGEDQSDVSIRVRVCCEGEDRELGRFLSNEVIYPPGVCFLEVQIEEDHVGIQNREQFLEKRGLPRRYNHMSFRGELFGNEFPDFEEVAEDQNLAHPFSLPKITRRFQPTFVRVVIT
jgi:hypothetical protein